MFWGLATVLAVCASSACAMPLRELKNAGNTICGYGNTSEDATTSCLWMANICAQDCEPICEANDSGDLKGIISQLMPTLEKVARCNPAVPRMALLAASTMSGAAAGVATQMNLLAAQLPDSGAPRRLQQVVDLNKIVAALPQQVLDAVEKSVGPLPPGELPVLDLQTVVQDVQGGVANAEASTPTEEAQAVYQQSGLAEALQKVASENQALVDEAMTALTNTGYDNPGALLEALRTQGVDALKTPVQNLINANQSVVDEVKVVLTDAGMDADALVAALEALNFDAMKTLSLDALNQQVETLSGAPGAQDLIAQANAALTTVGADPDALLAAAQTLDTQQIVAQVQKVDVPVLITEAEKLDSIGLMATAKAMDTDALLADADTMVTTRMPGILANPSFAALATGFTVVEQMLGSAPMGSGCLDDAEMAEYKKLTDADTLDALTECSNIQLSEADVVSLNSAGYSTATVGQDFCLENSLSVTQMQIAANVQTACFNQTAAALAALDPSTTCSGELDLATPACMQALLVYGGKSVEEAQAIAVGLVSSKATCASYTDQYSPSYALGASTYDPLTATCLPKAVSKGCSAKVLHPMPSAASTEMCAAQAALQSHVGLVTPARLAAASYGARGFRGDPKILVDGDGVAPRSSNIAFAVDRPAYRPGSFKLIVDKADGKSSTGALAIHAILIPGTDKVLTASRPVDWPRVNYEPGMWTTVNGRRLGQVSSVYDTNSGTYTVAPVNTAPFCMGHTYLNDGTIITGGGDVPSYAERKAGPLFEGRDRIRRYHPSTGWVNSNAKLKGLHWYPTLLKLTDSRVIMANGEIDPTTGEAQPLVEIYDASTDKIIHSSATTPMKTYKLYPALFLLPWTPSYGQHLLYSFNGCTEGVLMTIDQSSKMKLFKDLPNTYSALGDFCSASSAQAPATMLMLEPNNGYRAEVIAFGGFAFTQPGQTCFCDLPAAPRSVRMRLDPYFVFNNKNVWVPDQMPGPRVGADVVMLPNGKIVIVNGAASGQMQGGIEGGGQGKNPVLDAWLYDPYATYGKRYTVLAKSTIFRYYHSVALLLADGSVLVAGSEHSNCVSGCPTPAPALVQYQAEKACPLCRPQCPV